MYGEALNVGRAMFPQGDNKRFSEWVASSQLASASYDERSAATCDRRLTSAKLAMVLVLGNLPITVP